MRSTGLRSFGADTKREYTAKTQLIRDRETGPSCVSASDSGTAWQLVRTVNLLEILSRQSANVLDFYSLKRYTLNRQSNEEGFQLC